MQNSLRFQQALALMHSGDHEAALAALDQYFASPTPAGTGEWLLMQLVRGECQQQVNRWDGIRTLQSALDRLQPIAFELPASKRTRVAFGASHLALLLAEQRAGSDSSRWQQFASDLLDGRRDATARGVRMRVAAARKVLTEGDGVDRVFAGRNRGHRYGTVRPPAHVSSRDEQRMWVFTEQLRVARTAEDVAALVELLGVLARELIFRKRIVTSVTSPELAGRLIQTMVVVDDWLPRHRNRSGRIDVRESWLLPGRRQADGLRLIDLAWEFAERYCPCEGLAVLKLKPGALRRLDPADGATAVLQAYLQIAEIADRMGLWEDASDAYLWVARLYSATEPDKAVDYCRRARQQIENALRWLTTLDDRQRALKRWHLACQQLVKTFVVAGHAHVETMSVVEVTQGMMLAELQTDVNNVPLLELHAQEQRLRSRPQGSPAVDEIARQHELDLMKLRIRKAEKARVVLGEYAGEANRVINRTGQEEMQQLLARLGGRALILQFTHTRDDAVTLAASGGYWAKDVEVRTDLREKRLRDSLGVRRQLGEIVSTDVRTIDGLDAGSEQALRSGYETLLGPFDDLVRDADVIVCLSQGQLANLPLQALIRPDGKFVAETATVVHAPSLKALSGCLDRPPVHGPALLIAEPTAPGAMQEAHLVARRLLAAQRDCEMPTDGAEMRKRLTGGDSFSIIHLVAHGLTKPHPDSLASYVVLPEGDLTALDLLYGGTQADLAVLNACHLGNSGTSFGDLYGFPFALLALRARHILAAVCPLYSPFASDFAGAFYDIYLTGGDAGDAYRHAIGTFLAEPWTRHPAFWAAYLLIGSPH
jgi:CHAT domain-containing protein